MNQEEIMKILPHRDNMLLVETSEMLDENTAKGSYTVRGDEFFLQGHFPGNKVKFKNPVKPGDTLESVCTLTKNRGAFYFIDAKGYVDGKLCVSAELSFALVPNTD